MKKAFLILSLFCVLFINPVSYAEPNENYVNDVTDIDKNNELNKKLCKGFDKVAIPQADYPTIEERKALQDCDSVDLYYGIDKDQDFVLSRKCALIQREKLLVDDEPAKVYWTLDSNGILMMIYANGKNVPKNFNVAKDLSCETFGRSTWGDTGSDLNNLLITFEKMQNKNAELKEIDVCNANFVSGFSYECDIKMQQKQEFLDKKNFTKYIASWNKETKLAFDALVNSAKNFIELEVKRLNLYSSRDDACDSAFKYYFWIEFYKTLENLEKGIFPIINTSRFVMLQELESLELEEISRLNTTVLKMVEIEFIKSYFATIRLFSSTFESPATAMEYFIASDRGWIDYCTSWQKFGTTRFPKQNKYFWKIWFTEQRMQQLQDEVLYI